VFSGAAAESAAEGGIMSRRKKEEERIALRDACQKQAEATNHLPQERQEPDFIPMVFSVKNDQIILWKEQARFHQQSEGKLEQYENGVKGVMDGLKAKYGDPLGGVRVYDNGFVELGFERKNATTDELKKRAIVAGEDVWDEFYPQAAKEAVALEHHLLAVVAEQEALMQYFAQFTEEEFAIKMMGIAATCSDGGIDEMLKSFVNNSAAKVMTEDCSGSVGIMTGRDGKQSMAITQYDMPAAKYRFARAISNVARKVAAHRVFVTMDSYITDETGYRIGTNAHGSCAEQRWVWSRLHHGVHTAERHHHSARAGSLRLRGRQDGHPLG
jgi:hypothetical protein